MTAEYSAVKYKKPYLKKKVSQRAERRSEYGSAVELPTASS